MSALTNTPTSKATQDRQERLAQFAECALGSLRGDAAAVREFGEAGASEYRDEAYRRILAAARSLGLLGEGEARP